MNSRFKKLRNSREQGFTLIELLVVIVIIGVLAAIALPIFMNQQKAAADAKTLNDARNANTAISTWLVNNPTASAFNLDELKALQSYSEGVEMYLVGTPDDYCLKAFNADGEQYKSNDGPYAVYISATGKLGSTDTLGKASRISCYLTTRTTIKLS